jgi:hypothetical protein
MSDHLSRADVPEAPHRYPSVPLILLGLDATLITGALSAWRGPVVVALALVFVFIAPGLAWQNLRGVFRLTPLGFGLAAAMSTGATIGLGLLMNAASISLTRGHWTEALGGLVALLSFTDLALYPPFPSFIRLHHPLGRRHGSVLVITCVCVLLATGGGILAWSSQQHWLDRQHYTELYTTLDHGAEKVTVRNHEGEAITYSATIMAGGEPTQQVTFQVASGGTWSRTVNVDASRLGLRFPLLQVHLYRAGTSRIYRQLRLTRLQPAASPSRGRS